MGGVKIGITVGSEILEKVDRFIEKGEFINRADVVKTALIEWLKDRELKVVYKEERKIK